MANMLRGMKRDKAQQAPQQAPKQADPGKVEQVKTMGSALIGMAHDPKASKSIHKIMQSGKPHIAVPQAAMTVYSQFKAMAGSKGALPLEVSLPAYVILVDDLLDFGNQAGFFNVDEPGSAAVVENSFQLFIETGLKDKSIDPIELQEQIEPLMTNQQRQVGLEAGQATGTPAGMSPQMMTEQHTSQRLHQQEQGMLQKRVQQGQEQAPQGQQRRAR